MRRIGICALVLLCVLMTAPVLAAEGALSGGSWWDAVVAWVQSLTSWRQADIGGSLEPNGLQEGEAGGSLEPNGFGQHPAGGLPGSGDLENNETDIGGNLEPNG